MAQYEVGLSDEAKKDLGHISSYISNELKAPQASEAVLADLENALRLYAFHRKGFLLHAKTFGKSKVFMLWLSENTLFIFRWTKPNIG